MISGSMKFLDSMLEWQEKLEQQGYEVEIPTPKGKEIISNKRAAGIEEKEIQELKKLVQEKKISEKIEIKLTAPMIPAVLIGYLLVNLAGDLIWNIL